MRRLGLRRLTAVVFAGVSLACASGGASGTSSTSGAAADAPQRRDRTVITAADIRELSVSSLLEVVQRLHPEWLTPRNAGSVSSPKTRAASSSTDVAVQVYVDTQRAGTADILSQMSPTMAASLKYYSASEAQARFGNGNIYGAIQVVSVTKR
jgi:hypothetical protein